MLGTQTWPRSDDGQLMTPLAQIDLSGLAAHLKIPDLPETGSLAFFAGFHKNGSDKGAVRFVPGTVGKLTQPETPLRSIENQTFGGALRRGAPGKDQTLYPRMAMERVLVSADGWTDLGAFAAEVELRLGPARQYSLAPSLFKDVMPDLAHPYNRDSLLRFLFGAEIAMGEATQTELRSLQAGLAARVEGFANQLTTATEGKVRLQSALDNTLTALRKVEAILADSPTHIPQLSKDLSTLKNWALTGDLWQPFTQTERDMLAAILARWTEQSSRGHALLAYSHGVHRPMSDCVAETLLVMAVAEDSIFATLPAPVRDAINGPWRQPIKGRHHKMFGAPESVQTAAEDNAHASLLAQFQCDDVAGFHWGDAGVLQFWIRPDDLGAGAWDKAYMTFEGH